MLRLGNNVARSHRAGGFRQHGPPTTSGLLLLAADERHHGHRGAVLLVVVVERVVPPTAVLFLQRQDDVGQVILKVGPLGRRELVDAQRGVPVAVVVEVAGDVEMRFVRNGAFAAEAQPAVAGEQAIEPGLEHVVR